VKKNARKRILCLCLIGYHDMMVSQTQTTQEFKMDLGIFLTAVGAVISIIVTNIALISWLRADMKAFETKVDGWKQEITKEMTDFHGRLCGIESRYQNRRYSNKSKRKNNV
jgi:hypothetical protein